MAFTFVVLQFSHSMLLHPQWEDAVCLQAPIYLAIQLWPILPISLQSVLGACWNSGCLPQVCGNPTWPSGRKCGDCGTWRHCPEETDRSRQGKRKACWPPQTTGYVPCQHTQGHHCQLQGSIWLSLPLWHLVAIIHLATEPYPYHACTGAVRWGF